MCIRYLLSSSPMRFSTSSLTMRCITSPASALEGGCILMSASKPLPKRCLRCCVEPRHRNRPFTCFVIQRSNDPTIQRFNDPTFQRQKVGSKASPHVRKPVCSRCKMQDVAVHKKDGVRWEKRRFFTYRAGAGKQEISAGWVCCGRVDVWYCSVRPLHDHRRPP